ncbi:MAG: hypothetical protein JNL36_02505 [Candidatus Kapabacteria bacterium]|nr:hypothetical protein [Candidatus Kapabacteria bacterium]
MTAEEICTQIQEFKSFKSISKEVIENEITKLEGYELSLNLISPQNENNEIQYSSISSEIKLLLATRYKFLGQYQNGEKKLLEIIDSKYQLNQFSKAKAYNILGNIYDDQNDYVQALSSFFHSKSIYELNHDVENLSGVHINIARVYTNLGDYHQSLQFVFFALNEFEKLKNKKGISYSLNMIGTNYRFLQLYNQALEYFLKNLQIDEELNIPIEIASSHSNLGIIYSLIDDNIQALFHMLKAYETFDKIDNKLELANCSINLGIFFMKVQDFEKAYIYLNKALESHILLENEYGIAVCYHNLGNYFLQTTFDDFDKSLEYQHKALIGFSKILHKEGQMNCHKSLSDLYKKQHDFENALYHIDFHYSIKNEIQSDDLKNKALLFDQRRKIEEDEKARQLKLARFQEQEKILHNILPINIADRILNQETFIADHFQSVSVLFMDLVGFTSLSSIAPPKQLVYLLDTIFTKADEVVESFGLEKIKTIGDGYLAVANVTTPLEHHQKATALASLKLLETMRDFTVNIPTELGETDWINNMNDIEIRIGIHTGEVVAGIIGKNKYTYDLWGDAVNVASRMESNSEPGRIHVSDEFAESIENNPEFSLISRGEISIKGKGTMKTFWLEKRI